MKSILKKLQEDNHYYGAYGMKYLSNSNIGVLLTNPREFGKPQQESLPMVQGRYFHVSMLEPHKKDEFEIVDASSRTQKSTRINRGVVYYFLKRRQRLLTERLRR